MSLYEDLNDYELVSMALEQNEDAINLLYKKYQPLFKQKSKKFLRYTHDKGYEFDDLYQECIIAFEEAIKTFNSNEKTCFYTFVNLCLDRHLLSVVSKLDRQKHKILNEAISLDNNQEESDSNLIDCIPDNSNNPELETLSNEEFHNISNNILKILTNFEECVFILKVQGFTFSEIASILDKDEKSIYNTIQRIKDKIKKMHLFHSI